MLMVPSVTMKSGSLSAYNAKLKRPVKKDQIVGVDDVKITRELDVVALRLDMERKART